MLEFVESQEELVKIPNKQAANVTDGENGQQEERVFVSQSLLETHETCEGISNDAENDEKQRADSNRLDQQVIDPHGEENIFIP